MTSKGTKTAHPKRATAAEVAREAGVSTATVSYVLHGRPGVSEATRGRVLEVIDRLSYRPSQAANVLKSGQAPFIGLLLADIANPFYPELAAGVIEAATDRELEVFLAHSGEGPSALRRKLRLMLDHNVSGFILTSLRDGDEDVLAELHDLGVPAVQAVRRLAGSPFDFVGIDERAGGREAAEHVLAAGHRSIGIIAGPTASSASRERTAGMMETLEERGVRVPQRLRFESALTRDGGYAAGRRILRKPPSAVLCGNDLIALGLIDAVYDLGMTVPGDVAVVGYDNMSFGSARQIGLTTVNQPREEIGRAAVALLEARIKDPSRPPIERILQHELVVRTSCGAVQTHNP